ncbi:hypothetical protein BC628DRAFT_1419556 [Trametes gibbosa]|nr:hypothetical protein BC628DRAFT_1419556 [Trametes gibbosa]
MPAAKRKSVVLLKPVVDLTAHEHSDEEGEEVLRADPAPVANKARKSDVGEGSSSDAQKAKATSTKIACHEVVLEGEHTIRALQKQPDFKVGATKLATHWLKEIGNINNYSYQRFMGATGPTGGASNGTSTLKVRIAEGKKKTAKRLRNEQEHASGMPTEERRHMWVRC